jgi:hypothetical protein
MTNAIVDSYLAGRIAQLKESYAKVEVARQKLQKAEADAAKLYNKLFDATTITRNGATFTVTAVGIDRVLKFKKNSHGRFTIKENGKVIYSDFFGSAKDVALALVCGEI